MQRVEEEMFGLEHDVEGCYAHLRGVCALVVFVLLWGASLPPYMCLSAAASFRSAPLCASPASPVSLGRSATAPIFPLPTWQPVQPQPVLQTFRIA